MKVLKELNNGFGVLVYTATITIGWVYYPVPDRCVLLMCVLCWFAGNLHKKPLGGTK